MSDKIIIIGAGVVGQLMLQRIAELKHQFPDHEVVTAEEALDRGLSQSFEIKSPPKLSSAPMVKDYSFDEHKPCYTKKEGA